MSNWWEDRDNLAITVEFMADRGDDPSELRRMVEKPWCYDDEFEMADAVFVNE